MEWWSHQARKAEKLITLIAIPAYDPINIVKIILIINCWMDVWVIKACFQSGENIVSYIGLMHSQGHL